MRNYETPENSLSSRPVFVRGVKVGGEESFPPLALAGAGSSLHANRSAYLLALQRLRSWLDLALLICAITLGTAALPIMAAFADPQPTVIVAPDYDGRSLDGLFPTS